MPPFSYSLGCWNLKQDPSLMELVVRPSLIGAEARMARLFLIMLVGASPRF